MLSRVRLTSPSELSALKVLSKAVVATTYCVEFGKCFPVKYTSVNDLEEMVWAFSKDNEATTSQVRA